MILPYDASKEERDRLVKERQAKTAAAFDRMRAMIDEQTATMNMSTVSEKVRRQQLEEIRHELQKSLGSFYSDLETGLKSDMESIGQSVLNESEGFYKALNMPIAMSITSFPVEVMTNIVNGTVYEEKWYLSNALWGDYQDKLDDINEVIMQGVGLNLSTYEIAKNLEKYVDPNARKEWEWSKVYPGTAKTVDYNAQRLARTLINHAYQQNVVQHAKANPFSKGVKWLASGTERMCDICEERNGTVYPADEVPLDHPNGMCTFGVVTEDLMAISNTLADFVNGVPTEYDDALYAWYNDRAEVPIERPENRFAKRLAVDGTDISATWQRRPDQFDFEIEDVMNAQGFDGLPQVVSKEEFERLVKAANDGNGFIAQRTYSAPDQETLDMYRGMLYNGKWYVDCGIGGAQYGQGMYCAADYTGTITKGITNEMEHYQMLGSGRMGEIPKESLESIIRNQKNRANDVLQQYKDGKISKEAGVAEYRKINSMSPNEYLATYMKDSNISGARAYTETVTLDPSARVVTYKDLITKVVPSAQEKIGAEVFASEIDKLVDLTDNEKAYLFYRSSYGEEHSYGKTTKEDNLSWWRSLSPDEKDDVRFKIEISDIRSARIAANDKVRSFEQLDYGAQAALLGYDAINAEGHGESGSYTVVLNRTKLIIQEP